jgi:tetratricopeptide (TPR) repeat protein
MPLNTFNRYSALKPFYKGTLVTQPRKNNQSTRMKTSKILAFDLALVLTLAAFTQTRASSSVDAVRLYNEGVEAFNKHDLATAEIKFKAATESDPNMAEAHSNYGNALAMSGNYNGALAELLKAKAINPKLGLIYSGLGSTYQALGKFPDAISNYKKFLELDPTNPEATKVKSIIGMLQGEVSRSSKNHAQNGADDYLGDATQNGMTRWPTARMPIKIFITPGTNVPGYRSSFEGIVKQCFQDWVDAAQGKIQIEFIPSVDDAQIICSWTNNPKEMISSAEGGHAMVVPDHDGISKTHIYLLTIRQDTNGPVNDNYARRVDLHEIGHALGLLGHSPNPDDIMFGSIPAADLACALSEKDKNTILALYSADANTMAQHPLNMGDMIAGDASSAVVRAAKLNHEAVDAMNGKNFVLAVQKLEEAHKVDPNNEIFASNLGLAYGNCAAMSMMLGQLPMADQYFKKALPLASKSSNKANYASILKNYWTFLKATKRDTEASNIESKVKELGVQ